MFKRLMLVLSLVAIPVLARGDEKNGSGEEQEKIKAGPTDSSEKVAPGAIDKDAPREFKTTKSGLKYRVLRKSDKEKPTASDAVTVHYKGWLDNKTIFDSSYRRGEKISFPLNGVIPGWTEGMQLVGEGGMIELEIPSELGYGRGGSGRTIPPNARLHFIVELFDVK
jgi:FKBP-type peptidyl-prolyl cis-trans isomerase FkpA